MKRSTRYFDDERALGYFDVVFIVNKTGVKLVKKCNNYDEAKNFIKRCWKGNECTPVIHPNI